MRRRLHFRWQPAQIKALLRYGLPMMGSLMLRYSLDTLCRFLLAALVSIEAARSEEHTSELQSLMRISYAVFCLKKKKIYTMYNNELTATISKSNTNYY